MMSSAADPSVSPIVPSTPVWSVGGRYLDLSRPLVMGIVNVTPDSFSDGGRYLSAPAALEHAHRLIDEGADLLDIGGESTRPGAADVSEPEEIERVVPLIEALRSTSVPLSVDTSKPGVMRAAIAAGAVIVNDVRAFQEAGAPEAVVSSRCGLVLMHMQGTPRTMQREPHYGNVVQEVGDFLRARVAALVQAGVAAERIAVDPGFGFGKSVAQFPLLRELDALRHSEAGAGRTVAQVDARSRDGPACRRARRGLGGGRRPRGRAWRAYRAGT
jgi:dihydropteroate synthase